MKNRISALILGITLALSAGVIAQISGGGVEGGGRIPGGNAFATQYKNGNNFGGTGPGTAGFVLTSNGSASAPTYQAVGVTPGGSNRQIQYNNSGAFGGIALGTSGQVLTSNGSGSPSSFQDASLPAVIPGAHEFTGAITLSASNNQFAGTVTTTDDFNLGATFYLLNPVTPSALASGSTNDYNPGSIGSRAIYRLTANSANSTLTGFISAPTGYMVYIMNIQTTAGNIILSHQNASSSANNRIITPGEVSLSIPPGGAATLRYDGAVSRWRILSVATNSGAFPILAPNGTSGAPSYSFSAQATSGLWYDNSNIRVELRSNTDINLSANGGRVFIAGGSQILGSAAATITNTGAACTISTGYSVSSASRTGTGVCDVLFSNAFNSTPVCTASEASATPALFATVSGVSTSGVTVTTASTTLAAPTDGTFSVVCSGL